MADNTPISIDEKTHSRFWDKVDVRSPGECWEWSASRGPRGYGNFGNRYTKSRLAHRFSWFLHHGEELPSHIFVCHACDNPACVNPAHLWRGTHSDNMADMDAKGRRVISRGEGIAGAKLTESDVHAIRQDPRFHRMIAEDFGVSRAVIGEIKRKRTWAHVDWPEDDNQRPRTVRMLHRCNQKLDLAKATEAAEAITQGEPMRAIARRYGVDEGLIRAIKTGKAWKDAWAIAIAANREE